MSLAETIGSISPVTAVIYRGFNSDQNQFNFTVTINGQSFPYFMGIGHAKQPTTRFIRIFGDGKPALNWKSDMSICGTRFRNAWLATPEAAPDVSITDVIECLVVDAHVGSYTFEDYCDNFGADPDSRSAFDTYTLCRDTLCKMVSAFGFEALAKLQTAVENQ